LAINPNKPSISDFLVIFRTEVSLQDLRRATLAILLSPFEEMGQSPTSKFRFVITAARIYEIESFW